MSEMEKGMRVQFTTDVDRYPHFVVAEGSTGTVTALDDEMAAVKLDEKIEGAEEWENEVQWYEGMLEEGDWKELFREQVEPAT